MPCWGVCLIAHVVMGTQITGYVVLASDWNEIVNNFIAGATDAMTADGDIWVGTGVNAGVKLAAFTSSTGFLKQEKGGLEFDASAITTGGMVIGASAGNFELLAYGSDGQFIKGVSGKPAWAVAPVSRAGGQATGTSTVSTSEATMSTASSLTIAAIDWLRITLSVRKSSGAAATANTGLKFNATTVNATSGGLLVNNTNENEAQNGFTIVDVGSRVTDFERGIVTWNLMRASDTNSLRVNESPAAEMTADMVLVEITDVVTLGVTASASQSLHHDQLNVYEYAQI